MSDPIQEALAKAKAAEAANPVPSTAVATQSGGAVSTQMAPQKLTMETMAAGGMAVDKWLKVNENGLHIGESGLIVKPVKASIKLDEFVLKMAIKGGNPAQYAYTTDYVNAVGGGTWEAAQARIRALDQRASPYRAVDLPFTLEEDVVDIQGKPAGKAGELIGYTTSTTNWANWQAFFNECCEKGFVTADGKGPAARVEVNLTAQPRTNKNNNKWGVVAFELVGEKE